MNFEQLMQACEQTHNYLRGTAVSAVNRSLTIRNWLFGHHIVEYEQNGEDRAKYGDQLFAILAKDLKSKGIKGLSKRNLHYFCQLYLLYPEVGQVVVNMNMPKQIVQTVSAQFEITQYSADKNKVDTKSSYPQLKSWKSSSSRISRCWKEAKLPMKSSQGVLLTKTGRVSLRGGRGKT